MEVLENKIKLFLQVDDNKDYDNSYYFGYGCGEGYGCGYREGYGYGSGSGYGDGSGDGSCSGYGDGYGWGYGDGNDSGLKSINGEHIYIIDDVQTVIRSVKGNTAKGAIVAKDLTLKECFIMKGENKFAHGETLHDAFEALQNKLFQEYSIEERIAKFHEAYPNVNVKIPAKELFEWHNRLTGSCHMGRLAFANDNGIDIEHDSFTVTEFVKLTKDTYGGDIIKQLI